MNNTIITILGTSEEMHISSSHLHLVQDLIYRCADCEDGDFYHPHGGVGLDDIADRLLEGQA